MSVVALRLGVSKAMLGVFCPGWENDGQGSGVGTELTVVVCVLGYWPFQGGLGSYAEPTKYMLVEVAKA